MVEMDLVEIQVSEMSGVQIIILQEKEGTRHFAIFIGPYEASILEHAIKGYEAARPLTHDLILNVVESMEGKLAGVLVDELRNDTYHGKLLVKTGGGEMVRVDSRPSDAIVLAMKERVPIYVEEEVLRATNAEEDDAEVEDGEEPFSGEEER